MNKNHSQYTIVFDLQSRDGRSVHERLYGTRIIRETNGAVKPSYIIRCVAYTLKQRVSFQSVCSHRSEAQRSGNVSR